MTGCLKRNKCFTKAAQRRLKRWCWLLFVQARVDKTFNDIEQGEFLCLLVQHSSWSFSQDSSTGNLCSMFHIRQISPFTVEKKTEPSKKKKRRKWDSEWRRNKFCSLHKGGGARVVWWYFTLHKQDEPLREKKASIRPIPIIIQLLLPKFTFWHSIRTL